MLYNVGLIDAQQKVFFTEKAQETADLINQEKFIEAFHVRFVSHAVNVKIDCCYFQQWIINDMQTFLYISFCLFSRTITIIPVRHFLLTPPG